LFENPLFTGGEISMSNTQHRLLFLTAVVLLIVSFVNAAQAAVFNCPAGDTQCLILAINQANTNGNPSNTIQLEAGTYTFLNPNNDTDGANGFPSITSTVVIKGPAANAAIIARPSNVPFFRFFHVASNGNLSLEGITLIGGIGIGSAVFNNGGTISVNQSTFSQNTGTALRNTGGHMAITQSTISNNFSSSSGGGALGSDGGSVTIDRSQFRGNTAISLVGAIFLGNTTAAISNSSFYDSFSQGAGAILVGTGSVLMVSDSAFVNNEAFGDGQGAAIHTRMGATTLITNSTFAINRLNPLFGQDGITIANFGTLSLLNSTLARNSVDLFFVSTPSSPRSVLLSGASAITKLQNTIVTHDDPLAQDCRGPIISLGNNLISDPAGCTITLLPSDLTGDPSLDSLTDNGTSGNAHFPLLSTSPAINAANDEVCPIKDQIGQLRKPQCDIGAIEAQTRTVIDSYSAVNQDSTSSLNGTRTAVGQVFIASGSTYIRSCEFYLARENNPTGTIVAKLYAVGGTPGSTALPIGSPFAISAPVDISSLNPWPTLAPVMFDFTANQYFVTAGVAYAIVVEYTGGSSTDTIPVRKDRSGTHPGNVTLLESGTWVTQTDADAIFSLYGDPRTPSAGALIDSYDLVNYAGTDSLNDTRRAIGQAFTPTVSAKLVSAQFYLAKENNPQGTIVAKLYAVSPALTVPIGLPLAVSGAIDVSTLSAWPSLALTTFDFSASNFSMAAGAPYAIVVECPFGCSTQRGTVPVAKNNAGTHPGHHVEMNSAQWSAGTSDTIFYVYGDVGR
jgi:hypothetical protein